jgi:hypothetical protein
MALKGLERARVQLLHRPFGLAVLGKSLLERYPAFLGLGLGLGQGLGTGMEWQQRNK